MTAYVSLSGGMDSTATAAVAVGENEHVIGVGARYGQRHAKELEAAHEVAKWLHIPYRVIDLTGLLTRGESLVEGGEVPHGHYAEDSMSATVVNGRNLLFVSAIVGLTEPGDRIYIGVHGGDHFVYPDCRPSFVEPLATALSAAYGVELIAPWIKEDKAAIAASLPSELSAVTWSCYEGGDLHCGKCGTCVERAEAFALAGVDDYTTYADSGFWRNVTREAL